VVASGVIVRVRVCGDCSAPAVIVGTGLGTPRFDGGPIHVGPSAVVARSSTGIWVWISISVAVAAVVIVIVIPMVAIVVAAIVVVIVAAIVSVVIVVVVVIVAAAAAVVRVQILPSTAIVTIMAAV